MGKLKLDQGPKWWNDHIKSIKICFKIWQTSKGESDHQKYVAAKKLIKRMVQKKKYFKLQNLEINKSDIKQNKYDRKKRNIKIPKIF